MIFCSHTPYCRFITPSLFTAFGDESQTPVDEYHYTQYLGKQEALNRLTNHWDTWFTESDFHDMANNYGLNHVRIPIGYWAFMAIEGDPYVQGQEAYLDRAIGWARDAGLKVWVDLHGVPGSQNGFDNSGLRDSFNWQNGDNLALTGQVLAYMAQKYGSDEYNDVVTGIELVNEPLGPALDMGLIKQYYLQGYQTIRNVSASRGVVFHDAFMPLGYWNDNWMQLPDYTSTILDHHHYQVFSPGELARSVDDHIGFACGLGWNTRSEYHWRVVGEWSAALTDCTKWLNGVGKGPRYSGAFPGSYYIGSCDARDDIATWTPSRSATRADTSRPRWTRTTRAPGGSFGHTRPKTAWSGTSAVWSMPAFSRFPLTSDSIPTFADSTDCRKHQKWFYMYKCM